MSANLMGSPCNQTNLQQRAATCLSQRLITSQNRNTVRHLFFCYGYLIGFLIFQKITINGSRLIHNPLYCTQIILMKASILKQGRKHLKACQGFARCHKTAGIAIQPVADRGMEAAKLLHGQLSCFHQIGNHIFHQRFICILCFL